MELAIIDFLQNHFFQGLIYILSYAGHLFVLLGVGSVIYIAVNKELGSRTLVFYFTSMMMNAYIKEWVARPRPYEAGAETVIEKSTQPSMPSGHTQGFASFLYPLARKRNTRRAYILAVAALLFVCFTRVYLGQHYVSDVLVGAAIGIGIAILLELVYTFAGERARYYLLGLIPVSIVLMCVFPDYRDAFVSGGVLGGTLVGVVLDKHFCGYKVSGSVLNRAVKVLFTSVVGGLCMSPFVILYSLELIFPNLGIYFMFFAMLIGITFLSPLIMTKVKFFNKVFNKKQLAGEVALGNAD